MSLIPYLQCMPLIYGPANGCCILAGLLFLITDTTVLLTLFTH